MTAILEAIAEYYSGPTEENASVLADAIEEGIDCMNPILANSILEVAGYSPSFSRPIRECIENMGYLND